MAKLKLLQKKSSEKEDSGINSMPNPPQEDKSENSGRFSMPSLRKKDNQKGGKVFAEALLEGDAKSKKPKSGKFSIEAIIERFLAPDCDDMEGLGFDTGQVEEPKMGVSFRDVDITYEVQSPFQYAHVEFNGEELQYTCHEPPLSESEMRYLKIIESAFEKLTNTDILIIRPDERREALRARFSMIIDIYRLEMTDFQKEKMFYYLLKKYVGFGQIDILMNDPYIEDITCNGPEMPLYINHRMYGSIRTDVVFEEIDLNNFVMKMAQTSGRHISVLQPIRDATLADGSRVNLTLGKEVTKKGSTFTIRRFKSNPVSAVDLMNYGTFNAEVLAYLWIVVEYKRSILAAGGTASGKTTTLNAMGAFIRPEYKIVSIEDTAEMNLMHPNWTQSITRAGFGGSEGGKSAGDIELYDLLKAALRQRPEYIVVGEVRGAEASTLFQAISVGHPCMGTIHAGSMKELLSRVESEPMNVPRNLFSSLDVVIFNSMIKVGEHFIRRALRIVELVEMDPEKGDLITNPVFKWNPIDDTYIYSGGSAMFEAISEEFGIGVDFLEEEMRNRSKHLDWMQKNDIKNYEEVVKAIRRYARDKDAMLEEEHRGQKSHTAPGDEIVEYIEDVVKEVTLDDVPFEDDIDSLGNATKSRDLSDSTMGGVA
ncbi:flagellar protein FlaI [Methanohalophilus levihalophilus]|uniref:type II/IV secretion system ATPase subunit n=1 Tax=Methanohalophilus levihalophilus TaxID=1431282 RepID=UPI001FDA5609|nr:type II/IV secretion system ATPase subunit [Methanohalophilus levihalophilus]MBP2029447.1 flagellar protein FlaI [Methanohalophilus levihalophilus]